MHDLSTNGPMGRSVADVAALFATQAGYDPRSPQSLPGDGSEFSTLARCEPKGLRIGWLSDLGGHLPFEPGVLELCEAALGAFTDLGCTVDHAATGFDMERVWRSWVTLRHALVAGDQRAAYDDVAKRALLKPAAIWEIESGRALSAADIFTASSDRSAWYRAVSRLFETYDCLVLPSAQLFPFDVTLDWPHEIAGRTMDTYHRWMEVVVPASLLGLPTLALPAGFSASGLPMGFQLIGRPRADAQVLSLGATYEAATDWLTRMPALADD
ncbi:amidase family protein [Breoghania sp. L-A4]|uniref:amidase family protein n=1 Tax=Breoghania sp. L-A4 TaxID=2304600 RepID=UPI00320486EE